MFVITGWTAKQKRGRNVLKSIGSEPTQQQILGDNYEKIVNALKDNDQVLPRAPKPKPRPGPRTVITPARSGKSTISDLMATARTIRDKSVVQPSAGMAVELVSSSRIHSEGASNFGHFSPLLSYHNPRRSLFHLHEQSGRTTRLTSPHPARSRNGRDEPMRRRVALAVNTSHD
jgi:hypothetical protein